VGAVAKYSVIPAPAVRRCRKIATSDNRRLSKVPRAVKS
jgi:hypothetical protein